MRLKGHAEIVASIENQVREILCRCKLEADRREFTEALAAAIDRAQAASIEKWGALSKRRGGRRRAPAPAPAPKPEPAPVLPSTFGGSDG